MAHELGAGFDEALWIIQGFLIGSTIIQLVVGDLADLFGRVRLFNAGLLIFTLGGLASGLALSPQMLIASRILQGVGSAFLMTLSVTILTDNLPRSVLGTWLGVNQIAWRVGALLGLTLSGIIIDMLGWRWIYLFYVPMGFAAFIWSMRTLRETYKPPQKTCLDIPGFLLFTSFLFSMAMGLTMMMNAAQWLSEAILSMILATILFALFIAHERRGRCRALDLSIFRNLQFTGGIIAQLLYSMGFGASLTLIVIFLEVLENYSASLTGLLITPFELSFLVFGVVGGRISDKKGFEMPTTTGLLLAGASLLMLSKISAATSLAHVITATIILGIGGGLFISPNTSSIMTSVPPERRGVASAIRTLSFNIGFLISLNIAVISLVQATSYEAATQLIIMERTANIGENIAASNLTNAIAEAFQTQATIMLAGIPFSVMRMISQKRSKSVRKYKNTNKQADKSNNDEF
ncbi:MAG: MFS transporter [Aigarchaeota archaeon]|nr:MFS transporter [Candidatus Wolframiiraptor gerlachensis]